MVWMIGALILRSMKGIDSEEDMPLANLQGNRQRARPRQSLTTLTVSTSTAGPSSSASTSVTTLSGTIDSGGSGIFGTAGQFRDAGIEISDSSDDSDADVPLAQFVVPQLQPATAQVAPQLPPAAAPPVANPVAPQAGAQAQQIPIPYLHGVEVIHLPRKTYLSPPMRASTSRFRETELPMIIFPCI
ncbi:hypothetical protein HOLleu_28743 [Holothuria leucospilota]|uniref:Uncharacterized protein n=1 Tax=Holothuria leucospilota TaxID=206669 RepID=A0A9Q1BMI2_HOLLE|nr:hypothetical protein HOLleu_28743 [Holothuria leucospilota]